jgi:hypothetical protein
MSNLQKALVLALCFILLLAILFSIPTWPRPHAMEMQEVKPYVFANLPHGRIYKTVHEGCELYIVENDMQTDYRNIADQHIYSIATGRGCK